MQFDSFAEFVAMGGHGLYVWLAYGATIAVLVFSSVGLRIARRKQLEQLRWAVAQQGSEQASEQESEQGKVEHEPQT